MISSHNILDVQYLVWWLWANANAVCLMASLPLACMALTWDVLVSIHDYTGISNAPGSFFAANILVPY